MEAWINFKKQIVVRGDLQNREMVDKTCSPTASVRTLKYFLADAAKNKARVHQIDFIGALLQDVVLSYLGYHMGILGTRHTQKFSPTPHPL